MTPYLIDQNHKQELMMISGLNATFRKNVYEGMELIFKDGQTIDKLMMDIGKLYSFFAATAQNEASKQQFADDLELLTRARKFAKSAHKGLAAEYPSEKLDALEKKVQLRYKHLEGQLSGEEAASLRKRSSELFEAFQAHANLRRMLGKKPIETVQNPKTVHASEIALRWFLDPVQQKIFFYLCDSNYSFYKVALIELFYKKDLKPSQEMLRWAEEVLVKGRDPWNNAFDSKIKFLYTTLSQLVEDPEKLLQNPCEPKKVEDPLTSLREWVSRYPETLNKLLLAFNACEGTPPQELVSLLIAIGAKPESIWTNAVKVQKTQEPPPKEAQENFARFKQSYVECLNNTPQYYGGRTDRAAREQGINIIDDLYGHLFRIAHEYPNLKMMLPPPPPEPRD